MFPIPAFCNCQTAAMSMRLADPAGIELCVRARGRCCPPQQTSGRGRVGDHQIRKERTLLLASQELAGRGDQLASRSDLGPIVDRDRHQLFGRLIAGNEGDLQERRFHRLEQRLGLEQQDLRQASARDSPVANGDLLGLPQALELGSAPG